MAAKKGGANGVPRYIATRSRRGTLTRDPDRAARRFIGRAHKSMLVMPHSSAANRGCTP